MGRKYQFKKLSSFLRRIKQLEVIVHCKSILSDRMLNIFLRRFWGHCYSKFQVISSSIVIFIIFLSRESRSSNPHFMKLKNLISLNLSPIMPEFLLEVRGTLRFRINRLLIEFISIIYRLHNIFN